MISLWKLPAKSGQLYDISVSRPDAPAPAAGFPALYVLDADTAFATLADFVRNHARMFGPAVVIGIGYPSEAEIRKRVRDMTPPTDLSTLPPVGPDGWGEVGGADAFLDFLLGELTPVIARTVPLDPARRALFGHSLGGLFVLHTLFTRPGSFDTYIAGSPSIWWGQKLILKGVPAFQTKQSESRTPRRLLITVGEFEDRINPEERRFVNKAIPGDPDERVRAHAMPGNAAALAEQLRPLAPSGLQVDFALFSGETHCSVIPAYLARGARFTLAGWFA